MEYAKYPFKSMKITQNIGDGNHLAHWQPFKKCSDKPWDEAGKDAGQECFAPLNDFIITKIYGLNSNTTNTVMLKSCNKLRLPYGVEDYLYLTLTHINEVDLKCLKVGQVIKAGTINEHIKEGTDGQASGNHFHCTANIGKFYGLLQNGNGKWCYVFDKALKPEEAFYLDKNHTIIYNAKGSNFQEAPKEPTPSEFFGPKGYFSLGDTHENIGKIADFMYKTFPKYTDKRALGTYYGNYIKESIKEFQKRTNLEQDGNTGPKTLAKLVEYGFRY